MGNDLVQRVLRGDLTGMRIAALVRLSFERKDKKGKKHGKKTDAAAARTVADVDDLDDLDYGDSRDDRRFWLTGKHINNRKIQASDCRDSVAAGGGVYGFTFQEPHTSAYKKKRVILPDGTVGLRVVRPVLDQALACLRAGVDPDGNRIDALIVADVDRLTRDHRTLEDCIETVLCYEKPIIDITGSLDLLTEKGRRAARQDVEAKNRASADSARRVRRKHLAMQQRGIPTGPTRPFGWRKDLRRLKKREAAAVVDAVARILDDVPLTVIVNEWNAAGLHTTKGNPWNRRGLTEYFRNPRLCGYRSRHRRIADPATMKTTKRIEIVRDRDGQPVKGLFEPIISVEQWEALIAVIGANKQPSKGVNARKYLLTGDLRCGKCTTAKLRGTPRKATGSYSYGCPPAYDGGCSGVSVPGPETDLYVVQRVISKLEVEAAERRAQVNKTAPVFDRQDELDAVQGKIRDLKAAWKADRITSEHYFDDLEGFIEEERTLTDEREKWLAATYTPTAIPERIREEWDSYPLAQQRAYVHRVLIAAVIHPVGRGRRVPVADRIELLWRPTTNTTTTTAA